MRNQPPEFANVVLDSLTANIAVLDQHGVIIGVNEPWRRFSEMNCGETATFYVGQNYISVCEQAALSGDQTAASLIGGLKSVLDGRCTRFSLEYPCHSPDEERWFIVWITPCKQGGESRVVVAHEDITARKKAEMALARAELTLRMILEALPVGVWLVDRSGTIIRGNAAGRTLWGAGEYKGRWLDSGKEFRLSDWAVAQVINEGRTTIDDKILIEPPEGGRKVVLNSAVPLREGDSPISAAIIVQQDITARQAADEQLRRTKLEVENANRRLQDSLKREQRTARTDDLTGLVNRRHFFDLAEQIFKVSRRYGKPLSVVMLDVDHFKRINDRYGHQAGDVALKHIADCAARHLRSADVLARYGGEELILLLPESGKEQAWSVAESIRKAVAVQALEFERDLIRLSLSAGIAEISPADDGLERAIRRADHALYEAKSAGRNCCRLSGSSVESSIIRAAS